MNATIYSTLWARSKFGTLPVGCKSKTEYAKDRSLRGSNEENILLTYYLRMWQASAVNVNGREMACDSLPVYESPEC